MNDVDELQWLKFLGGVQVIAEDELGASVSNDRELCFSKGLYEEYVSAGKAKNQKAWIREQLKKHFSYVNEKPKWVESIPTWPFHNGRPMTFIGQLDLPESAAISVIPGTVLYVFGARDDGPEGSTTIYEVIQQFRS